MLKQERIRVVLASESLEHVYIIERELELITDLFTQQVRNQASELNDGSSICKNSIIELCMKRTDDSKSNHYKGYRKIKWKR